MLYCVHCRMRISKCEFILWFNCRSEMLGYARLGEDSICQGSLCNSYELPVEFYMDDFRNRQTVLPHTNFRMCLRRNRMLHKDDSSGYLKKIPECRRVSEKCSGGIERHRHCFRESCKLLNHNATLEPKEMLYFQHRKCLKKVVQSSAAMRVAFSQGMPTLATPRSENRKVHCRFSWSTAVG